MNPIGRCKHGHTKSEHPNCFIRDERIGFLDIEASNLNATFGICYLYCIKKLDGEIIRRSVTIEDLHKGIFDKSLLRQFIKDCELFDRLICHYGAGNRLFDINFLRTRAVKWKLPFPEYKFMHIADTFPILKNKFKLHSNRLEVACDFFGIPAKKHKLNPDVWLKMITGNPKMMKQALAYIMTHCAEDVVSLEMLWKRIYRYVKINNTSI
jgi:uncharacterized protein YprB with RNaseH-like and TPR domain